jgi:hypothetical protein
LRSREKEMEAQEIDTEQAITKRIEIFAQGLEDRLKKVKLRVLGPLPFVNA